MKLLDLKGNATDRGRHHGEEMATSIRANIETYRSRFLAGGASADDISEQARVWLNRFRQHDAEYYEEMQGIAEGSGINITDIALLNARYEIAYSLYTTEAAAANDMPSLEPEGCTSFGAQPEYTANGHTIIGQNWDWLEGLLGNVNLLRVHSEKGPNHMVLTQAGIVSGMFGLNEHGIGLCVNGLSAVGDGSELHHRPFHIRVRDIMKASLYNDALKTIYGTDRVCSTNWVIAQSGGEVLDIETSAKVAHTLYPEDGLITHGNHFINRTGIQTEFERIAPCSLYRTPRLERLIRQNSQKWDMDHFKACLKDGFGKPKAICRYPNPADPEPIRTMTVTSVIMDLDERAMEISDGAPDTNPYVRYELFG
ncbi:C45 family autoproteolytic acyltransferase/hydolase [Sneathiella glossodoripedis]|uniref:C45 family autoproteolytic acyltransferase/hydolase n=1 Tax=Sneathiella glossodoripedis TaxID=418853 RepID=UPI00055B65E5|nr:C45 family peptidase [Sneathiella glossodoripedis]